MNEQWLNALLGAGWGGKALAAVLAFLGAWYLRRPAEHAAVLLAVDKRVETLMKVQGELLTGALARCAAVETKHADCELKLTGMREELDALMRGPVAEYTTLKRPLP